MMQSPQPSASDAEPPQAGAGKKQVPPASIGPGPSTRLTRRWKLIGEALLILGLFLGLSAFVFRLLVTYPRGSVSGEIRSTGAPHGDFVVKPVTCFSGDHWGFDGVWLVTETVSAGQTRGFRGGLKIVNGGDGGWDAIVENPQRCQGVKCEQWLVQEQHCPIFDVTIERRHVWLRYSGHAHVDCVLPEGGTLKANLSFDSCGWVPASDGDV